MPKLRTPIFLCSYLHTKSPPKSGLSVRSCQRKCSSNMHDTGILFYELSFFLSFFFGGGGILETGKLNVVQNSVDDIGYAFLFQDLIFIAHNSTMLIFLQHSKTDRDGNVAIKSWMTAFYTYMCLCEINLCNILSHWESNILCYIYL